MEAGASSWSKRGVSPASIAVVSRGKQRLDALVATGAQCAGLCCYAPAPRPKTKQTLTIWGTRGEACPLKAARVGEATQAQRPDWLANRPAKRLGGCAAG